MGAAPLVELEGVNGQMFTLSGPGAGDRGVKLATDIQGLYDAPIKTIYNSHANQEGSTYGAKRMLQRDITFGVHVLGAAGSWEELDSDWRLAFDYGTRTSRLWIETETSRRHLTVALSQDPDVIDPFKGHANGYTKCVMRLIAADPWWYDKTDTYSWESTTDTTGITNPALAELGVIEVPAANPTTDELWPEWIVQAAPGAKWIISDYSWGSDRWDGRGVEDATRQIVMPSLLAGEHLYINTKEGADQPQVVSNIDTQIYFRMNGREFMYPFQPGMKATDVHVGVMGAPAGVGIQLRIKRPFLRPWGMRL